MANALHQYLDPNLLTQQAASGKAQVLSDPASAMWASMFRAANMLCGDQTIDTTATTVDLSVVRHRLVISGTMALTLANGTFEGQRCLFQVESVASTPALTLTITTPDATTGFACAGAFFFDTVGQELELVWTVGVAAATGAWRAVRVKRAGGVADNVVIGTTVLTNMNMWLRYNCSVTNTVSSTSTKALPNGSAVGEEIVIACTTVSGSPIGSLDGTYTSGLAAAYTHAGAIGVVASATAVGDGFMARWTGAAWDVFYQSGITFS